MFRPLTVFIGLRNFTSGAGNRMVSFISLLAILGLVMGVALLVVVMSVMNGFDREMESRILAAVPHIRLFNEHGVQQSDKLRDILEQQAEEDDSDRVQLLTMHASKGLEFPHVYLMGLEEDLLPHRNAIEVGTVEEERRLAYVGITRARRTLTLTLARQRKAYGELMDCQPSRFLDELPAEDLEWEGRADKEDPEKKQARGKDAIAGLRSLLG